MLFPYGAHMENILSYQRWTQTSNLSAADVHAMIGSPPVFRLRFFPCSFFFGVLLQRLLKYFSLLSNLFKGMVGLLIRTLQP